MEKANKKLVHFHPVNFVEIKINKIGKTHNPKKKIDKSHFQYIGELILLRYKSPSKERIVNGAYPSLNNWQTTYAPEMQPTLHDIQHRHDLCHTI